MLKLPKKKITLSVDAENVKYELVNGDELRLRQVLINTIGNAIKFTDKGGVKLEVKNSNKNPSNGAASFHFQVSDSGIGIPKEKLNEIFNPYEQGNVEKQYGGTGLGLSITKKIIELQNGSISIQSAEGIGTTLAFEIPFEKIETLPKPDDAVITESKKSIEGLKILLAEDDALNRELTVSSLLHMNVEVVSVTNGKQAIEAILTNNIDAVLMDIQMPEMNGKDATVFIREHISKTLPIIGITANMMNDAKKECVHAGMDEVILKPFDDNTVVELLIPLIQKHNASLTNQNLFSFSSDSLRKASNGKNDFVIKMLKVFITSNKSLLAKTEQAVSENDFEAAASNIHRLIPSFRQLSLDDFAGSLKKLEWLCLNAENKTPIKNQVSATIANFVQLENLIAVEISKLES